METKDVTLIKARPKARDTVKTATQIHTDTDAPTFMGSGIEGKVNRVSTPVRDKIINGLVYKEYHGEGEAAFALKVWLRLKEAGLPVPPTFRLVEEGDKYTGILMTDLTSGWRDLFISSNYGKEHMVGRVMENNPETVTTFSSIDTHSPEMETEISQKLQEISKIAATHRIRLPADSIAAIYNVNRGISFVITDMGGIILDSDLPEDELKKANYELLSTINSMITTTKWLAEGACKNKKEGSASV